MSRSLPCCVLLSSASLVLLANCGAPGAEEPPPIFGGQGASITPDENPVPPEATKSASATGGPCASPSPPGETVLLDDFEDNDEKPFKAFQREGWWYVAVDQSENGKVFPPQGKFSAEALPDGEASLDNQYAAHLSAEGYSDWGAVWGTTLQWTNDGIRCPYNASAFSGVRFRARGKGTVSLKVGLLETIPKDNGGACVERCYDQHAKVVRFSEEWQVHDVPFDRLQQEGWGKEARFEPTQLLSINFSAKPEHLPVDFWVDDIEFIEKEK